MDTLKIGEVIAHPSIAEALHASFGPAVPEKIEVLKGGLSGAVLLAVTVSAKRWVVRRVPRGPESDPARELACMERAAEQGIAPRLLYAKLDAEAAVSISEFVEAPTLVAWARGGGGDCVPLLATLLRRLHDGAPFPPFAGVAAIAERIAGGLAARGPELSSLAEDAARVRVLNDALAPHAELRPCHNDLNPGNILIDGDRAWLIDWAGACGGDPFHDVATPGVFIVRSEEDRTRLLSTYLGRAPNAIDSARLLLSRALALTAYSLMFAWVAQARRIVPPAGTPGAAPSALEDPGAYGRGLAQQAAVLAASAEYAVALATLR
ncbi:MAG TPA: phosphotransferase [Polyangiaceae bacterium]|jgi:aminoglycoside phosphotransferase (APT) family kinase protein